jgi:O-antigen/teichoic acid export membrane protein
MLKSRYLKNILTLVSGTIFSQIILLITLPILTRLYTAEEFGNFSLFVSIVSTLSIVAVLRYEQAIMLPKNSNDILAITQLSVFILIIVTSIIFFSLFFFKDILLYKFVEIRDIYYLIPLNVFFLGLYQIYFMLASKKQNYKLISKNKILQSSTISILQVSNGFLRILSNGLIISKVIGEIISALFIFITLTKYELDMKFNRNFIIRIYINAKKYISFPKYQAITNLINSLSQNLPIILLSIFYSLEMAGLYALTNRLLQAPISLIGGSVRQVYYQEASDLVRNKKNVYALYKRTTLNMLKLFIVPFFIVLFFGKEIFIFIFSEKWEYSGTIAQILIFWIFTTFINPPSTMIFQILHIQNKLFYIEFISIILRFLAFSIPFYFWDDNYLSILYYTVIATITNIYIIYFANNLLKRDFNENI